MSLYIGLMSGTSLDGIDVAIVDIDNDHFHVVAAATYPFDKNLRRDLLKLITSQQTHLHLLGLTDMALGYSYAQAVQQLLTDSHIAASDIQAIGCHGQTIFHAPDALYPFSMQIGNANVIAETTGITTIHDFRQRDMVLGGQGAPLVPAFHQALFQQRQRNRIILNIGGISNITILPADPTLAVSGFDTGPGNTLLDQWYQQHHQDLYDENGQWANGGTPDLELLQLLLADPFFYQDVPKSTGREYFNIAWLNNLLYQLDKPIRAQDVQKTLLLVTATSISDAIQRYAAQTDEVYLCGGGAHNQALIEALAERLPSIQLATTDTLGLAPDWVEACAFAWLASRTLAHQTGNLPAVTGAKKATILGSIYYSHKA